MTRKALGAVALAALPLALTAQTRTFEVASIKRNTSNSIGGDGARRVGFQPGGRFVMEDGTALTLVRTAFPEAVEVVGAPDWAASEHFDVQATAGRDVTDAEMEEMLRALLENRLKLVAHYETREKPIYSLMVARADGQLGPQLQRYRGDCAAHLAALKENEPTVEMPTPANGAPACGYGVGPRGIAAGGIRMEQLGHAIQFYAERPIIDKTGLAGEYELTLEMTRDVSVFTALREQLGLKLESDRAPLPIVVVESIQRPTED